MVCSIRALKMHSGDFTVIAGKPLDEKLTEENTDAVERGSANLEKHIENVALFGIPCVVAINRFTTDTPAEIEVVKERARKAGACASCVSEVWEKGGKGGTELASAVVEACEKPSKFKFLYDVKLPIKEKIQLIATKVYGAGKVEYAALAEKKIAFFTKMGWDKLPLCMAKTHLSLSHDQKLKGRPSGFALPIRDVRASVGAGFLYPLCGEMRTMPGLPTHPAGEKVDIDENGNVVGLF
jgi:formyltetrahydrofolate synthetase